MRKSVQKFFLYGYLTNCEKVMLLKLRAKVLIVIFQNYSTAQGYSKEDTEMHYTKSKTVLKQVKSTEKLILIRGYECISRW